MKNFDVLEKQDWYNYIPISVNDTYGDPFIEEQIDNTIDKLEQLVNHKAPVVIITKAPYNEAVLIKLRKMKKPQMLVVMYSLTGLDEGGYSFENREKFIRALKEIFNQVVILVRPIIRGRNDNVLTLNRIVKVAKESGGYLVLGGLHDQYKMKIIKSEIEDLLLSLCDELGVKAFYKSSCCSAYIYGVDCWMHDLGKPINIGIATKIGYKFDVVDDVVILDEGTTGDLNFLRMLTCSEVKCRKLLSNYNILSFSQQNKKYECTSSWFCWSTNINVCIDCDYCIIKQIEYLKKEKVEIGCSPIGLKNVKVIVKCHGVEGMRTTKLREGLDSKSVVKYGDVRTSKPCMCKRYR